MDGLTFEFSKLYTLFAKYYDVLESQYRDYELEAKWLSKLLDDSDAKSVLDISCGTGTHISRLGTFLPECKLVATDDSGEMLAVAREKLGKAVSIIQSDFLRTPFKACSFDSVICMYWSIAGLDAALVQVLFANISTLLRSGGIFVFDTENTHGIKEVMLGRPFIDSSFQTSDGRITRINHSEKIAKDLVDWKSYYLLEKKGDAEMINDRMTLRFFSRDQIEGMLSNSGLKPEIVLSSGLKEYYRESPTLYFVARKL